MITACISLAIAVAASTLAFGRHWPRVDRLSRAERYLDLGEQCIAEGDAFAARQAIEQARRALFG